MVVVGWTVWSALLVYTGVLWWTTLRNPNGGVRFLAGRCALVFSACIIASLVLKFDKVHLVWIAVVSYILSMTWNGMVLDSRVKRIPRRAELESKRTGEPVDQIIQRELLRWGYEPATPKVLSSDQ